MKAGDDARPFMDPEVMQDIQGRALAFLGTLPEGAVATVTVTLPERPGATRTASLVMQWPRDRRMLDRIGPVETLARFTEGLGQAMGKVYAMAHLTGVSSDRIGHTFNESMRAGVAGFMQAAQEMQKGGGRADA